MSGDDHRFSHSNQQVSDRGIRNQPRLNKKIDDLQRQLESLDEKLSGLNKQEILETRVEEKLRLKNLIVDAQIQRDQVEEQLKNMESQLAKVDSDAEEDASQNDDHGPMTNNSRPLWKKFEALIFFLAAVVTITLPLYKLYEYFYGKSPLLFHVLYTYSANKSESEVKPINKDSELNSGDNYQISFTVLDTVEQDNSYVYIFQIGNRKDIYDISCLFPLRNFKNAKDQINPVQSGQTYFLPDEHKYFKLNQNTGKESIYFLIFRKQDLDLESLCIDYPPGQQQRTDQVAERRNILLKRLQQRSPDGFDTLTFLHVD